MATILRYVDMVHLVYQWIPPQKPQALGLLSDRVDTSYKAAREWWAEYRAIRITKLDPTLSGDYSCTVSTYEDEDTSTAPLLVWVPSSSVRVHYWRTSATQVNVTCVARNVAPRPDFTLYTLYPDRNRMDVGSVGRMEASRGGGLWDVGEWGLIDWARTPPDTVVGCIVTVQLTKYRDIHETIYDPNLPIITTTTTTTTTTTPRPRHSSNLANNAPSTGASLLDFSGLFGAANRGSRRRAGWYLKSLSGLFLGLYHWRRGHL
ncbi:uncharacterized protein LOC108675241 isoform X2 [Hyalella azteca]|uniref:Uncharacterized protein LOC108675241 isoform X2 n=1 Tax=Hyalella azteca TaxID=294128 RepID=A0A979FV35_HYAAZ|nr:uncharacterized protein LOC108675241 isoform X2 [Hyalella azteca]